MDCCIPASFPFIANIFYFTVSHIFNRENINISKLIDGIFDLKCKDHNNNKRFINWDLQCHRWISKFHLWFTTTATVTSIDLRSELKANQKY